MSNNSQCPSDVSQCNGTDFFLSLSLLLLFFMQLNLKIMLLVLSLILVLLITFPSFLYKIAPSFFFNRAKIKNTIPNAFNLLYIYITCTFLTKPKEVLSKGSPKCSIWCCYPESPNFDNQINTSTLWCCWKIIIYYVLQLLKLKYVYVMKKKS